MKKILWLTLSMMLALCATAQTQQGYVKTKGRKGTNGAVVPGKRITGATVVVKGANAVVSQANGVFSFPIPANRFYIQSVKKQGYVMTDPEMLTKQYVYSTNPLILVLETAEQQTDDKLASERKIRRTLQRQLQQREDEIEDLKEQNKITREEYQKALQQLYAEQETNEKLIGEMAERYAQIDYDLMDEFNTRISDCILEGRLAEADSLLRSKGDIKDRIAAVHKAEAIEAAEAAEIAQRQQQLEQSKAGTRASKEDIGQDCYHFFEKFKLEHNNDSAAYYLAQRVLLDSTNVAWLADAGEFACDYLADYPAALGYFKRALSHAVDQLGEDAEFVALMYNKIGAIYRKQGKYDMAMDNHLKALDICVKSLGDEHAVTAMTHDQLGMLKDKQGDAAQALEHYLKALSVREKTLGADDLAVATSYNNLGALNYSLGNLDKAMEYFEKSLAISEKKLDADHPDLATSYSNIGSVYNARGENARALEYFTRALDIRRQALGDSHPDVALTISDMGSAYLDMSDYDKALDCYTRALEITQKVMGNEHPDVAICYNNIGQVYEYQRDYDKALQYYGKSLDIKKKLLDDDHPSVINTLEVMGKIYFVQKDFSHALECFSRALKARETALSDDKVRLADAYDNMGSVLYRSGEFAQALDYLLKGVAIREQVQGNHQATARTCQNIAGAYSKLADYEKSLNYYHKALDIMTSLKGENSKEAAGLKNIILMTQYQQALHKGKIKAFMTNHCITATVNAGENAASAQGLSGEYVLLEFADWNQDSETYMIDKASQLREAPKDLLLMQDGVISRHHFENRLGFTFGVKEITKEEKQRINQAYKQWKEQNNQ